MNFVKKTTLVVLTPIFLMLLFATALDFGILNVAGHPNTVKKIIKDSGIYNNVVSNALSQTQQNNSDGGDINLNDPAIKTAADKALSPQLLQNSTNQVIDGVYSWLDGKSAQPNFNVDLSGAKATFASYVGQAAQAKAAGLPICTSVPANFDVFNADCLPPGVSPAQAADEATASVLSPKGFLDNPVITASNVKGSNNQSVFEQKGVKNIPKQYQRAKKTPYMLAVLAILVGTALVFLRRNWQSGLRHVGITLVLVGLLMVAFAYGLHKVIDDKLVGQLKFDNTLLQADARSLIKDLGGAIEHNYYLFGIIYAVLGVVALAGPSTYARFAHSPAAASAEATPTSETTAPKTKPKKAARKIDL